MQVFGVPGMITPAADIFSLGGVLLTLFADHLRRTLPPTGLWEPYHASRTIQEISLSTRLGQAPEVSPELSPALTAIVRVRSSCASVEAYLLRCSLIEHAYRGLCSRKCCVLLLARAADATHLGPPSRHCAQRAV